MFTKKSLRVEIQMDEGSFKEGLSPVIDFKDLPTEVSIKRVSGFGDYSARIKIYGVSKEHLDMVTILKWREISIPHRAIRVFVNNGQGEKLLYEGNIACADPIYEAPDVYIDIQSVAGISFNVKSRIPPSSLSGEVSVADVFEKICDDYGMDCKVDPALSFMKCRNPYFNENGLTSRIKSAARAYGVNAFIHNDYVQVIPEMENYFNFKRWKLTSSDYIGYPKFTDAGIRIILDELIDMGLYDVFEISGSEVTPANRSWFVTQAVINASTRIGGKWFMTVDGCEYVEK